MRTGLLFLLSCCACGSSTPSTSASSGGAATEGGQSNAGAASSSAGSSGSGGSVAGSNSTSGGGGSGGAAVAGGSSGGAATSGSSSLETASGCAGVFNPDQLLEYSITVSDADYAALLADTTFSKSFPAKLSCGGESFEVALERKRSGGATKVGFKVDFNEVVAEQTFFGLKKLGFDNGVSSGSAQDDATARDVLAEHLGWRLMQASGAISSRSALAQVSFNGKPAMVFVNVEQIDKRFLADRLGEDDGWLYKKSGGEGDGLKTHETDGVSNPHEAWYCFWERPACSTSADLAMELPGRADIAQFLRFGAMNAIIGNTDGLLYKDNNYYHYDSIAGVRTYLPWDLDTTMRTSVPLVGGSVPGGTRVFTDVLFAHWKSDYSTIADEILTKRITIARVTAELERAQRVAGPALDADPALVGDAASATAELGAWWEQRLPELAAELP